MASVLGEFQSSNVAVIFFHFLLSLKYLLNAVHKWLLLFLYGRSKVFRLDRLHLCDVLPHLLHALAVFQVSAPLCLLHGTE